MVTGKDHRQVELYVYQFYSGDSESFFHRASFPMYFLRTVPSLFLTGMSVVRRDSSDNFELRQILLTRIFLQLLC